MRLRGGGAVSPLKIVLVLAGAVIALTAAVTGSAGLPSDTGNTTYSQLCPPDTGRIYCVALTSYDVGGATGGGLAASARLQNYDQNSLTNPVLELHWSPNGALTWVDPKPGNCSLRNEVAPATGVFISCTEANIAGNGSAANGENHIDSPLRTFYFDVNSTASPISWTATGKVSESGNDAPPPAANQEVRSAYGTSTFFDPATTNQAATFALAGHDIVLGTLSLGTSSLQFAVPSGLTSPYLARFAGDPTNAFCFGGLSCVAIQLTTSVPGSISGIFVWHFVIPNSPFGPNSARIVKRYDAVGVPVNADTDTFTGDYRKIEGARLDGIDYTVRNATATSFQLSLTPKGAIFNVPAGTTSLSLENINILGDQKTEFDSRCTSTIDSSNLPNIPSFYAVKPNKTDLEVWVCDDKNGSIGPGG